MRDFRLRSLNKASDNAERVQADVKIADAAKWRLKRWATLRRRLVRVVVSGRT